jgi:hypothetical protein
MKKTHKINICDINGITNISEEETEFIDILEFSTDTVLSLIKGHSGSENWLVSDMVYNQIHLKYGIN